MDYSLTPENYDGVTSALLGNGELCTTVGPTGFHTPPDKQTDIAHRTQHFVLAGRRRSGPQHPLINFGTLTRTINVDGSAFSPLSWSQRLDLGGDVPGCQSEGQDGVIIVTTLSSVTLPRNLGWFQTSITVEDGAPHEVEVLIRYAIPDAQVLAGMDGHGTFQIEFEIQNTLGDTEFGSRVVAAGRGTSVGFQSERRALPDGGELFVRLSLRPDELLHITNWLHFSDRTHFEFPCLEANVISPVMATGVEWSRYLSRSEVTTSDALVDDFRRMSLYTLRCQATPWSIPPTVSEEYWGAGTFHDEMYPFLGLLSGNHVEMAERVPYFRLTTLPQAMQRARGRGALYPWSSTEYGEERDPNGLWLTERFHLGQFAESIWMLWLYNRDRVQLDDLYPVLKEIARYFELNMLERVDGSPIIGGQGAMRTKACVDFDESVGAVTNGPFTICAAIASMEHAADAAGELARDAERAARWSSLAAELRQNLPTAEPPDHQPSTRNHQPFGIPDGKPLHYSILGPIFPFRIEVDSPRARASAAYIHEVCRSTKGWKPGFSEGFEGSNWMWTAGHLGVVHALQGNGDLAWEAIREAPASAGPFLSPNEHVDKHGVIHVPWFTTGCGGWLYALHCLFVQVDEQGTKLLPAIPSALPNASFRDLRAEQGVTVSGRFEEGKLAELTVEAPRPLAWRYRLPAHYAQETPPAGRIVSQADGWLTVEIDLPAGLTSLINPQISQIDTD